MSDTRIEPPSHAIPLSGVRSQPTKHTPPRTAISRHDRTKLFDDAANTTNLRHEARRDVIRVGADEGLAMDNA